MYKPISYPDHPWPDEQGYFGDYGGIFVAETLKPAVSHLNAYYQKVRKDPKFWKTFENTCHDFAGRPSPIYHARRLSENWGGAQILLKREDLNHTGAHKINNAIGQALLAKAMKKDRIIAETGAGQHGVATATVCARENLECVVYMGLSDTIRQKPNVQRMQLLGATIQDVKSGTQTLKDALNEALRDWVNNIDNTYYLIGSCAGPHPYPLIVRDFTSIIGFEAKAQCLNKIKRLPDVVVACVGGGSNAIGMFYPFLADQQVKLIGVEAGGEGIETNKHAAPLNSGKVGVLHGMKTYLMQNDDGQILSTFSISAGLDYPGVGPEHSYLKDKKRVKFTYAKDEEALDAFSELCLSEGIIPALETAHALAEAKKLAASMTKEQYILVNLSGRGDKDLETALRFLPALS